MPLISYWKNKGWLHQFKTISHIIIIINYLVSTSLLISNDIEKKNTFGVNKQYFIIVYINVFKMLII